MLDKQELINLAIKLGLPASIGVSIGLAVKSKREKMTLFRVILSYVVGIGGAYLSYRFLKKNVSEDTIPIFIAIISMTTEKIAEHMIYKWNIDLFLTSIIEATRQFIIKLISK